MIGPYGLKHCAVQPAIHRRTRAAARGADRGSSWHPPPDLQKVRSQAAEALPCPVGKVLRHPDLDERRMDIAVPEVGREELQPFLWIDAGAIPFKNAVHHERVTQVMNARPGLASWRLKAGSPQYVDEQPSDTLGGVAHSVLVMPEQARLRILRRPSPPPRFQVFTKRCDDACGQRQDPGLEELGLADGDRADLQIDVAKAQARALAYAQSGAIADGQHRIQSERAERRARTDTYERCPAEHGPVPGYRCGAGASRGPTAAWLRRIRSSRASATRERSAAVGEDPAAVLERGDRDSAWPWLRHVRAVRNRRHGRLSRLQPPNTAT